MALQSSGAISFNNINVELGVSGTTSASLGQASYRTLAGVASGAISMSNFYGKSNSIQVTGITSFYNFNGQTSESNQESTDYYLVPPFAGKNINGAQLNSAYCGYGWTISNDRVTILSLDGSLPQNHFTSITGNNDTAYTNAATGYLNEGYRTSWSWNNKAILVGTYGVNSGTIYTTISYT